MISARCHAGPLLVLAVVLALAGCTNPRGPTPGRTRFDAQGVTLPARILGNLFIVETNADKHGPWRFLVDTGSSVTLVSPEFARRYATDKAALGAPSVHVRSADGNSTVLTAVTLREIRLDRARFDRVQALVFDCAELSAHLGVKIDGVLGFPLFRDTLLTLDYPQARLVIAPTPAEAKTVSGATIKFNNTQRTPIIPVRLGAEAFVALIDSGSDGPLMLNPVGLSPQFISGPRPGAIVGTLTGNRSQEIGRLADTLEVGPYRFPAPIADLTAHLSSLGGEILRHFAITFDQSRNQVTFFRESDAPISSPPRRASGLSFSKTAVYWRVAGVIPGSPADAAGIQTGDLVSRINGEPVAAWPLSRIEPLVRHATEITFTFLQGSRETPIVVPTMELVP